MKLITRGQIFYNIQTIYAVPKGVKFKKKTEWWLHCQMENEELSVNGYSILVGNDEKVLKMVNGAGCTIFFNILIPLNPILKNG